MTHGRTITFELPFTTPTLNEIRKLHWSKLMRRNRALSWEVKLAIGTQIPAKPLARARVRIERYSLKAPDYDNMVGGYKGLLDCLLPPGTPFLRKNKWVLPHPCGLSIIADDNPDCIEPDYPPAVRVGSARDQKTVVLITELPTNR